MNDKYMASRCKIVKEEIKYAADGFQIHDTRERGEGRASSINFHHKRMKGYVALLLCFFVHCVVASVDPSSPQFSVYFNRLTDISKHRDGCDVELSSFPMADESSSVDSESNDDDEDDDDG
jgi:hypothetical protein